MEENYIDMPYHDTINVGNQDILADSYMLFNHFFSGAGNLPVNSQIKEMMNVLWEKYRVSKNDVLHDAFSHFIERGIYIKFDPDRGSLTTFIAYTARNDLWRQLRKYGVIYGREFVSLDQYMEWQIESDTQDIESAGSQGKRTQNDRALYIGAPEQQLINKELVALAEKHFGTLDTEVMMGYMDRKSAARELSLPYETYRKRLLRKIHSFRPALTEAGYLN